MSTLTQTVNRIRQAWQELDPRQRLAAVAALGLLLAMFLPWYQLQSLNRRTGEINTHSISAFGDISFVEAAVFLVAAAVLALLFFRANDAPFHLPGGDGSVITGAGGWATLLIFYRVFDRPEGGGYPVGIEWGFFIAFIAAGALTLAGWRVRTAHLAEPPLPAAAPLPPPAPPRRPREPRTAQTRVATRERPDDRPPVDGGEQLSFDE